LKHCVREKVDFTFSPAPTNYRWSHHPSLQNEQNNITNLDMKVAQANNMLAATEYNKIRELVGVPVQGWQHVEFVLSLKTAVKV